MAEWQIICDDVIRWAAEYDGPKFHALLADPSYALSKKKKVDPDTPVETEIKTVEDLVKAYHSFQQWGDTGFMSKSWDTAIGFNPETWRALAEHLLPGGFLFVFASSRGWHRLACALEDAGLIIQPSIFNWHTGEVVEVPFCLGHLTGQSFPKATNISRGIDKAAGKLGEREVVGERIRLGDNRPYAHNPNSDIYGKDNAHLRNGWRPPITVPATDLARAWEGHRYGGQVLKDALTPIIVAQKPWEGKRLDCIIDTGAGTLNIEAARIRTSEVGKPRDYKPREDRENWRITGGTTGNGATSPQGRWPANFVLCHSEGCERVGVKRVKSGTGSGVVGDTTNSPRTLNVYGNYAEIQQRGFTHADPDGLETVDAWRCVEGCPVRKLGEQSGEREGFKGFKPGAERQASRGKGGYHGSFPTALTTPGHNDKGTAARYFFQANWSHEIAERIAGADSVHYCPKAAKRERQSNLDNFYWRKDKKVPIGFVRIDKGEWEALGEEEGRIYKETSKQVSLRAKGNIHPTCKPISLNVWLAKLLAPPKEYAPRRILIPFSGTMSEGIGAMLAGWEEIVGIDSEQDYCDIGEARMKFWSVKAQETGSSDPKAILKKGKKNPRQDKLL